MTCDWAPPVAADVQRCDPAHVFQAGERHHHIANTAYPIGHSRTWGPYRIARDRHVSTMVEAWDSIDDFCLYTHVPFCEVRCAFCEYTVVGKGELDRADGYMAWLGTEMAYYRDLLGTRRKRLLGLDIGGGTPSLA